MIDLLVPRGQFGQTGVGQQAIGQFEERPRGLRLQSAAGNLSDRAGQFERIKVRGHVNGPPKARDTYRDPPILALTWINGVRLPAGNPSWSEMQARSSAPE